MFQKLPFDGHPMEMLPILRSVLNVIFWVDVLNVIIWVDVRNIIIWVYVMTVLF